MEASRVSSGFDNFLLQTLPDVDESLAKQGFALSQRPLRASLIIVNHCILEIEGDTKEDYWSKSWFKVIFSAVEKWYEKRYGNALQHQKSDKVVTVVSIFGTPFRADVPLVVKEPPLPDKTFWLCFPISVAESEDHMSWIVDPPNFDISTAVERDAASSALIETAMRLRSTHVNLMTTDHPAESIRALAEAIVPHLERSALDIASQELNRRPMALWELNFACEKVIKTFLRHQCIAPKRTHDVRRLHAQAVGYLGPTEIDSLIDQFPSELVAVKHRYGELPAPPLEDLLSIYRTALVIASGYSQKLTRKFTFNNARFQLKMPPWLEEA